MIHSSIARRYARALLAVAEDDGDTEGPLAELAAVRAAIASHPELGSALTSPSVSREARLGIADALGHALKLHAPVGNLLKLLAERARFPHFEGLVRAYEAMADEKAGRVRGKLTAAMPVSQEAVHKLEKRLSLATTRMVKLEPAVDGSLLGGVVAQVGSMVYDGSLKTQLARLRRELKED